MSVLVKEMKMPKDCPMCPLSHWNAMTEFTGCSVVSGKKYAMNDKDYAESSTRPDWCPLVDVPTPHGRLIDADEVIDAIHERLKVLQRDTVFRRKHGDIDLIGVIPYITALSTLIEADGSRAERKEE